MSGRPDGRADSRVDGLPWTLSVAPAASSGPAPRRPLLALVLVVVGVVLAAGWYSILRAIAHELRVARLQGEFVAAVSHEFRSPLGPLTSLSHVAEMLAEDRIVSTDRRQRAFDVLVRDASRLRRLVEDLLDVGRFEAGAQQLHCERIDVAALVRALTAEFQARAAPQAVTIALIAPSTSLYARADAEALMRAVWNLLDNAVKYSPGAPTIWVTVAAGASGVSIAVRDEGIGIPAHEQRDIFQRFVRGAESTARRIRGTGIGLALVRHIVEVHGGEVRLASEHSRLSPDGSAILAGDGLRWSCELCGSLVRASARP